MGKIIGVASVLLLSVSLSSCSPPPPPSTSQPPTPSQANDVPKVKPPSPEMQAYEKAVNDYNDFVDHPKGHTYNVRPKERQLELCYLSAQVVITAVRIPEFQEDRNSDNEINEWRRWIDIRKDELHCQDAAE
jgi:hypothetical protein